MRDSYYIQLWYCTAAHVSEKPDYFGNWELLIHAFATAYKIACFSSPEPYMKVGDLKTPKPMVSLPDDKAENSPGYSNSNSSCLV